LAFAATAQAYPSIADAAAKSLANRDELQERQFPGAIPPFDAKSQYVSNTGKYAFVPPSGNDQRGPCPGLNAMANHGYMPHNGVGSMADFVTGTFNAFGMGPDIAEFLAVYGGVFDGNLLSYSIGGPTPSLLGLGGLLGQPRGLSGSHNNYEGDNSPVRGDLYQYGNGYLVQLRFFKELYERGMANGNKIDLNLLTEYRHDRFQRSIAENPYFFNAPFSGVIASPAAWSFIYRFMANHTAENPEGVLDLETLKTFYSITGDYPNFTYTPGHEKFPDNWYRRNNIDAYTIPYFSLDNTAMLLKYPIFASVGGNTGKVNTFTGVNPADLTGGVFNGATLLQGNNLWCYALQTSQILAPDALKGLFSNLQPALSKLSGAIGKVTSNFGCPQLTEVDKNQFSKFPGFTELKSNGAY